MQLSKRLKTVAELVTPGNRVADVGCDHAYTSIYLAKHKISSYIIAMDINQGPLDRAEENIIKYQCEELIEVRKSDGLRKLMPNEADTIIIAGMGGGLTSQILSECMEIVKATKELILQPQSEIFKVRQLLTDYNFIIINENMIKDEGKYYVIIKAVPLEDVDNVASYQLIRKEHFYYGRLLLEQKNKILEEYLLWDLKICDEILKTLADGKSDSSLLRKNEIQERIDLNRAGLAYY